MDADANARAAAALALAAQLVFDLTATGRISLDEAQALTDAAAHLAATLDGPKAEAVLIDVMAAANQLRGLPPSAPPE